VSQRVLVFTLLFLSIPWCYAIPYFNHPEINGSHSLQRIWSIKQDDTGYLWFATQNGLFRFDGYDARNYSFVDDSETILPSLIVKDVVISSGQTIWAVTYEDGLFYKDGEVFRSFTIPDEFDIGTVFSLYDDKESIWVGGDRGVLRIRGFNNGLPSFKAYKFQLDGTNPVLDMLSLSEEQLLIASRKGLFFASSESESILPKETILSSEPVYRIHRDQKKQYLAWR
jgi:ligand-binding sensor domain-containing protein